MKKKLVVLTGAGVSAESGLKTFRDSDGLWEGYAVTDVATPEAWRADAKRVLDFYNQRRRDIAAARPNAAHEGIRQLEEYFHVHVITQNIDDLHERAGSRNVLHLHGEIFKKRSERDHRIMEAVRADMEPGALAPDGGAWRPHIVWFGEEVPLIATAATLVNEADVLVIVGTSLVVYPAAGLLSYARGGIPRFIVDRKIPSVSAGAEMHRIEKPATEGIVDLMKALVRHR